MTNKSQIIEKLSTELQQEIYKRIVSTTSLDQLAAGVIAQQAAAAVRVGLYGYRWTGEER